MDSKGYYKTLGVNENATDEEIKKSYRRLSAKFHPDKNVGKSDAEKAEAEKKFKEINEAYQTLGDEAKRKEYDNPTSGMFNGGWDGGYGGGFGFGGADFNSIFESVFGQRNNNRRSNGRREYTTNETFYKPVVNGSDIRAQVALTLEEIYKGCTKNFKYNRMVRCKTCHGEGGIGTKKTCNHCHGSGSIMIEQQTAFGMFREQTSCPQCHGRGYTFDTKCPTCGGKGYSLEEHTISVTFPAGIRNGWSVTKVGEGNEAVDARGKNGDCYITVIYAYDDKKYSVDGLDVTEKIFIPYYDALLGCDYTLTLPNGTKKKINITSCIPNGKLLRLTGEGIHSGSSKGDYYLEVNYVMPQSLDAEERKKLEDIKVLYYKKENTCEADSSSNN